MQLGAHLDSVQAGPGINDDGKFLHSDPLCLHTNTGSQVPEPVSSSSYSKPLSNTGPRTRSASRGGVQKVHECLQEKGVLCSNLWRI